MTKLSTCSTRFIQITQPYRHLPYSMEFYCLCHLNKGIFSITLNMSKCAGGFWWVLVSYAPKLRQLDTHPQVTVLDQNTSKNVLAIHQNCLTCPSYAWSVPDTASRIPTCTFHTAVFPLPHSLSLPCCHCSWGEAVHHGDTMGASLHAKTYVKISILYLMA